MVLPEVESNWISQCKQGDHAAFAELVREHQRMIHAVTFRMTGSMSDSEDLAQDTFVKAYEQIGSFHGNSKFSTWVCRIAINHCLNWRARESKRGNVHEQWAGVALTEANSNDEILANENHSYIQAVLDKLPPKQRAAIVLTIYEELSHAQAARILNCSEATVSWRVFAARTKLKRWLKKESKQ